MPRINEYPETQQLASTDLLLIDQGGGVYKSIEAGVMIDKIQSQAVDLLYYRCIAYGVTPEAKTPRAVDAAMEECCENSYAEGRERGYDSGKADAEAITWTDVNKIEYKDNTSSMSGNQFLDNYIDIRNAISLKLDSFSNATQLVIETYNASTPSDATTALRSISIAVGSTITFTTNEKYAKIQIFDGGRHTNYSAQFTITRQAKILR